MQTDSENTPYYLCSRIFVGGGREIAIGGQERCLWAPRAIKRLTTVRGKDTP